MFNTCAVFHLTPYKRLENGSFAVVDDTKYLYIHYLVIALQLLHLACKVYVQLLELIIAPLGAEAFISICHSTMYIVSVSIFLVATIKYREIVDTLNTWPQFLSCVKRNTEDKKLDVFENTSSSLKVIMLGGIVLVNSAAVLMGSLIFNTLPVFCLNILDRFGMIPSGVMPHWILWAVLFLPIEFVGSVVTLVGAVTPGAVMLLGFDSFKIFIEQLR